MDIKSIARIKSSRFFNVLAIAVGVLAIAAGGGAQAVEPVPSVPAVVPAKQQPVVTQAPIAPAPAPEITAKAAKPEPAAKKSKPKKKRKAAAKPKKVAKPEQAATPDQTAKLDSKPDTQDTSQQAPAQPQDVLLKPANSPAEPEPAEPAPVTPVEPVEPVPAPVESVPVAPAEPAPAPVPVEPVLAAPVEPAPEPNVITPKYNDIVTAVLRGDRDAAKELLDLGWWVDKPSDSGITPLMAAVMNRDTEMVQMLLEYGAEPTLQALNLARKNKDTATALLLEQKGAR